MNKCIFIFLIHLFMIINVRIGYGKFLLVCVSPSQASPPISHYAI